MCSSVAECELSIYKAVSSRSWLVLFSELIWSNIFNLDKKEENSVSQSKFANSDLRQENDSQVCLSVFNSINVYIEWDNKCR